MPEALATRSGTLAIDRGVLPTTEVIARVHRIQEVMRALMKEGTHFGTIPGTPKPTLYKPGAELLLMTFRIAANPCLIDDLSTSDEIRYRVTVRGTNQQTVEIVGEMVGECSSSEAKYKWQKPVNDAEWEETDPGYRREKWFKGKNNSPDYKQKQIRTSPPDVANTILKMATKRALIAMTLVALGASDIFAQDLEDLTEELRESIVGDEAPRTEAKQPQRKSANANGAAQSKPIPADAKFVVGVVQKVDEPAGKKFSTIRIKGDARNFNAWNDSSAALIQEAKQFVGTDHTVKLAYTETVKDGKTFYNPVGISIADAEPVKAAPAATAAPDLPLTAQDIFGGAGREPGEDG